MFWTVLGAVPYMVMGVVLGTQGITWKTWPFWVIMLCMTATDFISWFKATKVSNKGF